MNVTEIIKEIDEFVYDARVAISENVYIEAEEALKKAKVELDKIKDEDIASYENNIQVEYLFAKSDYYVVELNLNYKLGNYSQNEDLISQIIDEGFLEELSNEPKLFQPVSNLNKEFGDTFRALQKFDTAKIHYEKAKTAIESKKVDPNLIRDIKLAIAITDQWLNVDPPVVIASLDEFISKEVQNTEVYKEDVMYIPSDIVEAHLSRATIYDKLNSEAAKITECEAANAILKGIDTLSPNQENLKARLDEVCNG